MRRHRPGAGPAALVRPAPRRPGGGPAAPNVPRPAALGRAAGRVTVTSWSAAEREDGVRVVRGTRLQDGGRETRLVRRVGEVLGLEGVTRALPVGVAADADQVPVEEVPRVELDARFAGPHGELTPACRVQRL